MATSYHHLSLPQEHANPCCILIDSQQYLFKANSQHAPPRPGREVTLHGTPPRPPISQRSSTRILPLPTEPIHLVSPEHEGGDTTMQPLGVSYPWRRLRDSLRLSSVRGCAGLCGSESAGQTPGGAEGSGRTEGDESQRRGSMGCGRGSSIQTKNLEAPGEIYSCRVCAQGGMSPEECSLPGKMY